VNADSLKAILQKHEMLAPASDDTPATATIDEQLRDCYQEVANIAMGHLGDGISGEALCILTDSSSRELAEITQVKVLKI